MRLQILGQVRSVGERELVDSRLEEKIERIDGRQIRDEVHIDSEFARLFLKNDARKAIIVGVQLPVEDVIGGSDFKRVAEDWRAAMERGTQLDHLWTEGYRPFVSVACPVMQRNLYSHLPPCGPCLELWIRYDSAPRRANSNCVRGSRGVRKRYHIG
jgi:hypothetical protein